MKYLCLAYEEEKKLNALSQSEWDALRSETLAYVEALRKSGHLIVTHALQSVQTTSTVRVRSGKQSVTDGPFAETKEQLGGFFLIDARDLNEAIQVASRWPSARLGSIEVRPIGSGRTGASGKHDLQVKFDVSSMHDIHRAEAAGGTSVGSLAVLGLTRFSEQGLAELKALAERS